MYISGVHPYFCLTLTLLNVKTTFTASHRDVSTDQLQFFGTFNNVLNLNFSFRRFKNQLKALEITGIFFPASPNGTPS